MASAKLDFLGELLEVLVEEGRRILIFSQFTTMLGLIEEHLQQERVAYLKLTGESKDRGSLVERRPPTAPTASARTSRCLSTSCSAVTPSRSASINFNRTRPSSQQIC